MRIGKGRLFLITWNVFRWWNWRHRWGFTRPCFPPGCNGPHSWRLSLGIITIGWNARRHSPSIEMNFTRKHYLNDGVPCELDAVLTLKGNAYIDYDERGECLGLFVGEDGSATFDTGDWKFPDPRAYPDELDDIRADFEHDRRRDDRRNP